jgi:protein SCO1
VEPTADLDQGAGRHLPSGLTAVLMVLAAVLVVAVGAGVLIVRATSSKPSSVVQAPPAPVGPQATWAAGARPAPDFRLTDQAGKPVSIARFRGRPVIVTFIDPLCRNLCPLEARILERAWVKLPAAQRPAIVSVSVNRWGNARRYLLQDVGKWDLHSSWYWAVGPGAALAKVWSAYQIGVRDVPKTIDGVTVHNIEHTEGSYVVDTKGDVRALLLYPFTVADVTQAVTRFGGA